MGQVEQSSKLIGRAYFAAELFNLPARYFNDILVKGLEDKGIQAFSPQRDGFEFSQLAPVLARHLPSEEIETSLNVLIYAYDIKSIWESDLVVARFDEPPDPGVDAEVLFANVAKIPVIAYRTDVRSPYGNTSDKFAGMHSFPIKGSQILIIQNSSPSSEKDLEDLIGKIVTEAETLLQNIPQRNLEEVPEAYRKILKIANMLFEDVNIHTEEGLAKIAKRYMEHVELMHKFGPLVVR